MEKVRIIARLDCKPPFVIKPVHFEGLRKMGTPHELAAKYYSQGADEIMYIDIVASLYRRQIQYQDIVKAAEGVFVPFCVGGGIQTVDDIAQILHSGADKVVMNTFALANPQLISEAAEIFGSQCIVVSIEAKSVNDHWVCYTDCGRINSTKDVVAWAQQAQELGAGELLITSVDAEGRKKGFDINLTKTVASSVSIPVIAGGGAGSLEHIRDVIIQGKADAVALASVLHYDNFTISDVKEFLLAHGIEVSL